jgi:hypothetical protein
MCEHGVSCARFRMDTTLSRVCSDLQAAIFGGGGAAGRARALPLRQLYILNSPDSSNDDAASAAITVATETLCTHFLSCAAPNTIAQHLLVSAVAAHILPFPAVAETCRRLSSNFSNRSHLVTYVHTVIACLRSSCAPPPRRCGRSSHTVTLCRPSASCSALL